MTDLEQHVNAPGRDELVKQVREKINELGIDYIYYQFISVTGRIVGKGRLVKGYDADFTIVDMSADWEITDDWIASRCGWTPYAGFRASARPVATIIRGQDVMRDGELIGSPAGKPMRFLDTLQAQDA